MYHKDPTALNHFGELKYITQAKHKIEWYDIDEPKEILRAYTAGNPLRAIADEHGRSIDQIRDFVAKLKAGTSSPPTHFAVMKSGVVMPDYEFKVDDTFFRDGTPQQRTPVFYKVPGRDCYICPTNGRFYSVLPDPHHLEGDSLGLENDTVYSLPCGTLSAAAAVRRTFWEQKTFHSLMLFNPQIISNVFPWCRSFTEESVEFAKSITGCSSILEDLLYIDAKSKLQSFYPDVVTHTSEGAIVHVKCRGVATKVTFTNAQIASRNELRIKYGI